MRGVLHVHSENSLKDSAIMIEDLCVKAKELGYEAIALTDHGNMTGIAEFIKKARKHGLKPIPGVELNIRGLERKGEEAIMHIVLMAKDYTGYVGLCKAVSHGNKVLENGVPILEKEDLSFFFGSYSIYHGHVAATSACCRGVLASPATHNQRCKHLAESMRTELDETVVNENDGRLEELEKEIKGLEKKLKELNPRIGKNFQKKEEMAEAMADSVDKDAFLAALEAEKKDCAEAEKEYGRIKARIAARKKKAVPLKEKRKQTLDALKKKELLEKGIQQAESRVVTDKTTEKRVFDAAEWYQSVFGTGDFYVELMYHGRREEFEAIPYLLKVSQKFGIPTVLSNDVHILSRDEDEVLKCQIVRSLNNNEWIPPDKHSPNYDLKSEEDLKDVLSGVVPINVIESSFENMHAFFDSCSFDWPKEKHYPKYVDEQGRPPEIALEEEARKNIPKLFKPGEWTDVYEKNLMYELPIINKTGYADYTLIIADILKEGRKGRHDGKPGCYIGPGRGSGAGSLVNYLIGITNIDPIKYGLVFERYLNIERVSPPDIDSDIATSIRDSLVKSIIRKYSKKEGKVGVCSILTKSRLTAKAAVRAAGRVVSSKYHGNAATLYFVGDRIAKAVPAELHVTISSCEEHLMEMFQDDVEREIIRYAKLIEGVMSAYGTHAAGIIISDSGDVTDYAPVINMGTTEEPIWNIQYDKEESEEIGLLKLDALGLKTLDVNTNTMQRIERTKGIRIDLDKIPFEKKVFKEIYGKGNTHGVFQCESAGMKRMWMQLQPDCIDDIIAGVALYRPGPMDFIPQYIEGKKHPSKIKYLDPHLEPILGITYGTIIYQEQVMRIVRDLAGYSMGRSDIVRRAMSKKKESIMNAERQNFVYGNENEGICGCIANGISEGVAHKIYDLMIDFAKYAFNRSHSAAYAIVSYQSAWLKYHYPKEYLIEAMNLEPPENYPLYLEECKRYGFTVRPPDINVSQAGFTEYDGDIIYGLGNVRSVKKKAETIIDNRKPIYKDFADYLVRSGANRTVTKSLIKAGAFLQFCRSRNGLLLVSDKMMDIASKYQDVLKKIAKRESDFEASGDERKKAKILELKNDAARILRELSSISMPHDVKEKAEGILDMEKESMFAYVSVHPLDRFASGINGVTPISSIDSPGYEKVAGVIENSKKFMTSKNREMAVFDLEDKTGKIKVICFPDQYAKYGGFIQDNGIVRIGGELKRDKNDNEELVLFANRIGLPYLNSPQAILLANDREEWEKAIRPSLDPFLSSYGRRVLLYIKSENVLETTDCRVSDDYESVCVRRFLKEKECF